MKAANIATAIALFVGIAQLPIGYYTFLRILVFIVAGLNAYFIAKDYGITGWVVFFGIATILFNPIIPVYLHNKSAWAVIDGMAGIGFIIAAIKS